MLKLEKLEERIVLDASAMLDAAEQGLGDALEVVSETLDDVQGILHTDIDNAVSTVVTALSGAEAVANELQTDLGGVEADVQTIDVVLIADNLDDSSQLLAAVASNAHVVRYDADIDNIADIANRLKGFLDERQLKIGTLSLMAHGGPGYIEFGNQVLTAQNVAEASEELLLLSSLLSADSELHLYNCNVVDGTGDGQALIDNLAEITETQVYGSDDITGQGGDWALEYGSGGAVLVPDMSPAILAAVLRQYSGQLAGPTTSNPILWVKADVGVVSSDPNNILGDGDEVAAGNGDAVVGWLDQSGSGNHLAQLGATIVYSTTADVVNGQAVVQTSSGAASALQIASLSGAVPANGYTVYLVAQDSTAIESIFYQFGIRDNTPNDLFFSEGTTNTSLEDLGLNTWNASNRGATGLQGLFDNPAVIRAEFKNADAANFQIYVQGDSFVESENPTFSTNVALDNPLETSFTLGAGVNSGSLGSSSALFLQAAANFAEVLIYNGTLSDAENTLITNYLAAKWGGTLVADDQYAFDSASATADTNDFDMDLGGIIQDASGNAVTSGTSDIFTISNASALANSESFLVAHDGGDNSAFTTTNTPAGTERIARAWRFDETGAVGTVTVTVDVSGLPGHTSNQGYVLLIDADADGDFTNATQVSADADSGDTRVYSGVTIADGAQVTIAKLAGAPVIGDTGGTVTFDEDANAVSGVVIDSDITITDSNNIKRVTVQITNVQSSEDLLEYNAGAGFAQSYDANTGLLTITHAGTTATAFQNELRTVTYRNTSQAPNTTARTIEWIATDETDINSSPASSTVNITAVNDVPTFTAFASVIDTENEDTEVELTLAELNAQGDEADVDGTIDAYVVQAVSTGTLKIGTSAGSATAFAAGTNDTISATLNAYWTPASNINGTLDAFTVKARDDGGALSATAVQAQVTVLSVNDLPTLSAFGSVIETGNEDIELELTVAELNAQGDEADVDGTVDSYVVQAVSSGTLNIGTSSGTATPFAVGTNDVLSATLNAYWTPASNVSGTLDAFTVKARDNDGGVSATTVQAQVLVNAVNDAPTLTAFASVIDTVDEDNEIELTFAELNTQGDEADVDGTVDAYVVQAVSTGNLRIGTSSGVATAFSAGTNDVISATLNAYWTPAQDANGTLDAFNVVARDDLGALSVTPIVAQVAVNSINDVPTLTAFTSTIDTVAEDTEVELTFAELNAQGDEADVDGSVDAYVVQAVSTGTLKIGTSAGSATAFAAGTNDIINATLNAYWTADLAENGVLNAFTVKARDDLGALSNSAIQAQVNVSSVNNIPTLTAFASVIDTVDEDNEIELTFAEFNAQGDENDIDGTVDAYVVQSVSSGVLKIGNTSGTATAFVAGTNDVISNTLNAYWTPDSNANGTLDAFTVKARDDASALSATAVQAQVEVNSINDLPTLTSFTSVIDTVDEDTEVELTFAELNAQGDEADVDGTVDAYVVQAVSSGSLRIGTSAGTATAFAAGTNDTITATLNAYWTADLNDNGTLNAFTVKARDNTGDLSTSSVQARVTVNSINDLPTLTSFAAVIDTVDEDTELELTLAELNAQGDEADVDGVVDSYVVQAVTSGTLRIGANAGTATDFAAGTNDIISAALNAYWTPAENATGTVDAFTVKARDSGGALSATAVQAQVTVNPINDAPTLTSFAAAIDTVVEDNEAELTFAELNAQGDQADVDGTVDAYVVQAVSTGTLKIGASAGTATAFATGSNDIIDAGLNAYWTPDANANGTLNAFTVKARDNDGVLSTTAVQAQLTVTGVNDAAIWINLDGGQTYQTGSGNPVVIDSNASISDAELDALNSGNGDYQNASLRVQRLTGADADDVFGFASMANVTVDNGASRLLSGGLEFASFTNASGTLTISFNSASTTATTALVNEVIQAINFRNDVDSGTGDLQFRFDDGQLATDANASINIQTAPTIIATDAQDGVFGDGQTITVAVTFSEAVAITGSPTITLVLDTGEVTATYNDTGIKATQNFSYTVTGGDTDADGVAFKADSLNLNGGTIIGQVTNQGALTTSSASTAVQAATTVDSTAPGQPQVADLAAASDSNINTDNITSDATPTLQAANGSVEANSTVNVFADGVSIGTTTADANGAWTLTPVANLANGVRTITTTATDAAGNTSAASAGLVITIDTTATTPVAPDLAASSDSNTSTDNITSDQTPTFQGANGSVEANASVEVFSDGVSIGVTTADANGAWSLTPATALTEGVHAITVKITDVAGNLSTASSALSVTVDASSPATPSVADLAATSDTGSSATDDTTNDATPTLQGANGSVEANAAVEIFSDGISIGTTTADANGAWSFTPGVNLTDGAHAITVTATDAAGNTSAVSAALSVTVDTSAPNTPSAPGLDAASDSGSSNTDRITRVTTPTVQGANGSVEAGSVVEIFSDSVSIGTTTANASGAWSFTPLTALIDGSHTITATATDSSGNTSAISSGLTIQVDTTTNTPANASLSAASDTGSSNSDLVTASTRPTVSGGNGSVEANSQVEILLDGVVVGTETADANGAWTHTFATALTDGSRSITARYTDAAGNLSTQSSGLILQIDSTAPDAAAIDSISTSETSPALQGTGITETTTTVEISIDGRSYQATSAGGGWSLGKNVISPALSPGKYSVVITVTDLAGNQTVTTHIDAVEINAPPTTQETAEAFVAEVDLGSVADIAEITQVESPEALFMGDFGSLQSSNNVVATKLTSGSLSTGAREIGGVPESPLEDNEPESTGSSIFISPAAPGDDAPEPVNPLIQPLLGSEDGLFADTPNVLSRIDSIEASELDFLFPQSTQPRSAQVQENEVEPGIALTSELFVKEASSELFNQPAGELLAEFEAGRETRVQNAEKNDA